MQPRPRSTPPRVTLSMLLAALLLGACASLQPARGPGLGARAPETTPVDAAALSASAVAAAQDPLLAVPVPPADAAAAKAGEPALGDAATAEPEGPAATLAEPVAEPALARLDLWQRVRAGFAMPDLDGDLVRKWEQFYAGKPDYVQRMTSRGGRYLYHIVEEVERRGMPAELALLPFVESAFNPQAASTARASGLWQFMPATGKEFELRQNLFRDDRRSVLASTRAALDYLQRLHTLFDDWQLALAAYNWGQGNVQRAIERNRRQGLSTEYASLSMPEETRNYVPKLQAVKNIVAQPQAFALDLPALQNHPYFLSVNIARDIDVALAAELAGLSLQEFQELNPQHNKPVILAAGTPQLLLPYDNAGRFVQELAAVRRPLASWTAWVAPRTLKPADAARLVGVSEATLREINRIPLRMLLKAGSTLLVPRSPRVTADVAEHIADNGMIAFTPEGRAQRRVSFKVGPKGDSLQNQARLRGVAPARLAALNKLPQNAHFAAGQVVTLVLPPAPVAVAAHAPASGSHGAVARKAPIRTAAAKSSSRHAVAPAAHAAARPGPRVRVAQR